MSKGIDLINNFIDRALDTGKVSLIKCLDCGCETMSLSLGEEDGDIESECGDCLSDNVEVSYIVDGGVLI